MDISLFVTGIDKATVIIFTYCALGKPTREKEKKRGRERQTERDRQRETERDRQR